MRVYKLEGKRVRIYSAYTMSGNKFLGYMRFKTWIIWHTQDGFFL